MSIEENLVTLEDDESVNFSPNPHAPAIRVIVTKGFSREMHSTQFSVLLSEIALGPSGPSLMARELDRYLTILRKQFKLTAEQRAS